VIEAKVKAVVQALRDEMDSSSSDEDEETSEHDAEEPELDAEAVEGMTVVKLRNALDRGARIRPD
jgi:hypothetical protein